MLNLTHATEKINIVQHAGCILLYVDRKREEEKLKMRLLLRARPLGLSPPQLLGRGEVCAILGPNGRGKTTLLKCLLGLHRLKEGRMSLAGAAVYVPQTYGVAFSYSVLELVLMGRARHLGLFASPGLRDVEMAKRALERVDMSAFAERPLPSLSGGER